MTEVRGYVIPTPPRLAVLDEPRVTFTDEDSNSTTWPWGRATAPDLINIIKSGCALPTITVGDIEVTGTEDGDGILLDLTKFDPEGSKKLGIIDFAQLDKLRRLLKAVLAGRTK